MSYQPPPDPEKDMPKLFALNRRIESFRIREPVKYWFRLWLLGTLVVALILFTEGLAGFDTFRGKAVLTGAVAGWIYPFFLWVKRHKSDG
jgi:hypothetical protein